jgi:hypothetical protein
MTPDANQFGYKWESQLEVAKNLETDVDSIT